jgi:hypothetical protein
MNKEENNFPLRKKNFKNNENNENFPEIFLKERKNLIKLIYSMIKKLNFSLRTFHHSIFLLDILIYKNFQKKNFEILNNLKISAISVLVLSGKKFY